MQKIVILIGENDEGTTNFFLDSIPSTEESKEWYLKKHANFDVIIYKPKTLDHYRYFGDYFPSLGKDHLLRGNNIIQYLIYPSTYYSRSFSGFVPEAIRQNITILYDDLTQDNLAFYKKEYKTEKAFHIKQCDELFEDIVPGDDFQINNTEMALLIGEQGVGKTKLFQIATNCKKNRKTKFNYFYFSTEMYQLVDCPSFVEAENKKEAIINQYSNFLGKSVTVISTFFLLVKYDRFDIMKRKFFEQFQYFKNFKSQIVVIIMNWEQTNEEEFQEDQEQIFHFFHNVAKIQQVNFLAKDYTSLNLVQFLQAQLSGKKGIDLKETIFCVEDDQQMIKNLTNQADKIEQAQQQSQLTEKQKKREFLIEQNTNLQIEAQQLEEKLKEIQIEYQKQINQKRQQFAKNRREIQEIELETNKLAAQVKQQTKRTGYVK